MRRISKWTAVIVCLIVALCGGSWSWTEEVKPTGQDKFKRFYELFDTVQTRTSLQQKEYAMSRQRRIIYNDDGTAEKPSHNPEATAEGFLDAYFNSAVGSQVDSWFYNVGNGYLTEDGDIYPWGERRQTGGVFGDGNQLIIEAARQAGMEIFASLRMSDLHDAYLGLDEPLKLQRPDLLMGEEYWPGQYPHLLNGEQKGGKGGYPEESGQSWFFAALDYAKPEVRQYRLDFIRQICSKYDWDGLELNFLRCPTIFKFGEEEDNLDTMTEFIHRVRETIDEIGQKRGRPYLLAVATPPTPEQALRSGMDVEQWLVEDLIDLLIPNVWHLYYTTTFKEFVDMGHRYGVPVYPCIGAIGTPACVPTVASNFWALGADGIYLYNFPYVDRDRVAEWLNQIGGPDTLLGVDKCYCPDYGAHEIGLGHSNVANPFPMQLIHGPTIEIMVGDDVQSAAQEGLLEEIRLHVGVENMHEIEGISLKINGTRIPAADIERTGQDLFEVVLQTPPVQQGINQIIVLPGLGCIGRAASVVTGLELWVRYKHE